MFRLSDYFANIGYIFKYKTIIQNKFENYCKYIMIVMKINIYHQTIIMSHLCQPVQI